MPLHTRVGFIGAGKIAESMIKGLLKRKVLDPKQIIASGRHTDRLAALTALHRIKTTLVNTEALASDFVVLSVKPHDMPQLLGELEGKVASATIVISVAAGVDIATISKGLAHSPVVRAMPNILSANSKGITLWMATDTVGAYQKARIRTLFRALGIERQVSDERTINKATAIFSCGPAMVISFVETMIAAAIREGLPRNLVCDLIPLMVKNTAEYPFRAGQSPEHMRTDIVSPAGATAELLYQLEKGGFAAVIFDAFRAASLRIEELGRK